MSQIQKYVVVGVLALLAGFGLHSWTSHAGLFTGFNSINLTPNSGDSYLIANNGVPIIGTSSQFYSSSTLQVSGTSTVGGLQIDSGATIQKSDCATATWNPAAISSSTVASTSVALANGVVAGNLAFASFNSPTSTEDWYVTANAATGSIIVFLNPVIGSPVSYTGTASLNLTTSTVRACYFAY